MKFIHLSNVRLGGSVDTGFPEIPAAEERWLDFENVISACRDQGADALFITGNLFDAPPTREQLTRADECFGRLNGTRVFYLTGKADAPADIADILAFKWQSQVTVFAGDTVERIYMAKEDAQITAAGYSEKTWDKIDAKALTRGKRGSLQILLLPFLLDEDSQEGLDQLSLDFDYIGTGQKMVYKSMGRQRIFSPGCFSPEDFSSQVSHGYFLCRLTAGKKGETSLTRQFVRGVKREFISLSAELTPDLSLEEVKDQLTGTLKKLGPDNIYEIVLEGAMPLSVLPDPDALKEVGLVRDVKDQTDPEKTAEGLKANQDDVVSRFAEALFQSGADELQMRAFKFGLEVFGELPKEAAPAEDWA